MHRRRNRQAPLSNRYGPHTTDFTRWPVVLRGADYSALKAMPVDNAGVLEFAAILGEAIARAHLAGKGDIRQMNANNANRKHFDALSRDDKIRAICGMADTGYNDYSIASSTQLSIEMVRQILATRRPGQ